MSKFKVGDKVVCLEKSDLLNLVFGEHYIVTDNTFPDMIVLEGIIDRACSDRFELIESKVASTLQNHLHTLKTAINGVKMHDKDLFMLQNILSSLEDEING
jgi:hypothetical protein